MLVDILYDWANRAAGPVLSVASPFHAKLRRGLSGRNDAVNTLTSWAAAMRQPAKPLVWVHAPSVGEALMAQAIIGELRGLEGDVQIAFTHFSPSAERVAARVGGDVHGYLPWDTRRAAAAAVNALRPSVLAFVRTEIWPAHMAAAQAAGARLALVNAVIAETSSRLRGPARRLLAPWYERLDLVAAVSDDDARRLPRLGVDPRRIEVAGDARFDQVHRRTVGIARESPLLTRFAGVPTLVAGSTWPADEARLAPAFAALRRSGIQARLVVAPHEPTETHLAAAERAFAERALRTVRLEHFEAGATAEVVIVDRVGVLADLYAMATAAFVGGGFGRSGLHSVVEPAALGVPVSFGPAVGNAAEALALAASGGGRVVADAAELEAAARRWFEDPAERDRAGRAAGEFVARRLGAARRIAERIAGLLD